MPAPVDLWAISTYICGNKDTSRQSSLLKPENRFLQGGTKITGFSGAVSENCCQNKTIPWYAEHFIHTLRSMCLWLIMQDSG